VIQIDEIHIEEFRGIRDLHLHLDGDCFVVWGPNGTGKSGVVDAIEFALTGDISRLSGSGSGGVTVAEHGPHVHRRNDSARARVSMMVRDTASGDAAVLTRSVKTPSSFQLDPDLPAVRSAVLKATQHPEMTLSRREIIKFVVTTPGDRSKEVQALLKLERLGAARKAFRSAKSKTATALKTVSKSAEDAQRSLERHLDIPKLLSSEVLAVVNVRRKILGLQTLDTLADTTNLADGMGHDGGERVFNRDSALRDVDAVLAAATDPAECAASADRLEEALLALDADSTILQALKARELVEAGLAQVEDEHCPLCGTAWTDMASLQAHLAESLQRSQEAAETLSTILTEAKLLTTELGTIASLVKSARLVADRVGDTKSTGDLDEWAAALHLANTQLATIEGVTASREALNADAALAPEGVLDLLQALSAKAAATPDQTATSDARSFLTIAQERWLALRSALAAQRAAADSDELAQSIYRHYCDAQDQGLALLYQEVQERFAEFYRTINSDDEGGFKASLEPSAQKLNLMVDFYSLGMFPPVAYHSEGHQDGMGVCIYLALMERILGEDFRLAILDDVVMSVDVSHRRQFCTLLTTFFPNVQFIITTHDEVWARQMQKSGLVAKSRQVHFLKWNVDDGPAVMEGDDFWDRIAADIDADDVSAGAARLRRNLEGALADLADELGGLVPYKAGGGWDLGELMDAVKGRYGKLLKAAAASANSRNDDGARASVDEAKARLGAASLVQDSEQWAVNPAVHYNDWANFSREDFRPVVEACRAFLDLFRCSACETQIHLTRSNGNDESMRCSCGDVSFNLISR